MNLRTRIWPVVAAMAVLAVGIGGVLVRGSAADDDVVSPTATVVTPPAGDLAWARGLVDAWDRAARQDFVPAGDWEFAMTGHWDDVAGADRPLALALDLHRFSTRIALPDDPPAGTVRWADGRTGTAVAVGAGAAFERMLRTGIRCANCPPDTFDGIRIRPLTVTAATPATMRVRTSRGTATIPAWRFTFAERSGVQVLQAAVRSDVPASINPNGTSPLSLRVDDVRLGSDGRSLTGSFTGAPAGTGPCTENYVGYAVESGYAVGLLVIRVPRTRSDENAVCTAIGAIRSVTVRLDKPLADRVVIETVHGTAVPVQR